MRATPRVLLLAAAVIHAVVAMVHHNKGPAALEGHRRGHYSSPMLRAEARLYLRADTTRLGDPAEKIDKDKNGGQKKAEEKAEDRAKAKAPKVISKPIPSVNRTDPGEMLKQAKKELAKTNKNLATARAHRKQVYKNAKRAQEALARGKGKGKGKSKSESKRRLGGTREGHSEEVNDKLQADIEKQDEGIDKMERDARSTEAALDDRRKARAEERDWRPKWMGHHLAALYRANAGDDFGAQAAGRIKVQKVKHVKTQNVKKLDIEMKQLRARMAAAQHKHKEVVSKANDLRADVLVGGEINELMKKHEAMQRRKKQQHRQYHPHLYGKGLTQSDREIIGKSNHKMQNAVLVQQYIKRLRDALEKATLNPQNKQYRSMVKALVAKVNSQLHGLTAGYEKIYKKKQKKLAAELRKKNHEKAERRTKRELQRVRDESSASTEALYAAQVKLAKVAESVSGTRATAIAKMMDLPTVAAEKRIKAQASKKEKQLSRKATGSQRAAELAHKAMFLPRAVIKAEKPYEKKLKNTTVTLPRGGGQEAVRQAIVKKIKKLPVLQPLTHMPTSGAKPTSKQAIEHKARADKIVKDVQTEALKIMEAVHALKGGDEKQQKKDLQCSELWGELYMLHTQIDVQKCQNGGDKTESGKLTCSSLSKNLMALEGKLNTC